MDNLLKKRVLYFRDLLAEYPGCTNPVITVRALSGVDIACIINGAVHFFTTPDHENCLEAFITCDDCYQSAPLRIVKCFCDDEDKCPICETCDANYICQPKCPDQPCVNGQCFECDQDHPCKDGKVCTNGKCGCPVGWKQDSLGICRECVVDGDCEGCDVCYGYQCKPKVCSFGAVVNPKTCGCVECYDSAQCTEPNTCCTGSGTCECCPGYYRDPITGNCEKYPACVTGECPPCMDCINKNCQPVSCPPNHIHVGNECCLQVCDCSNPSCPPGYSCWPVPGQNICVCRSCNVPCSMGVCPEWCDCNGSNCVTKVKKCSGYCDENTPCPYGCGCDLSTNSCLDCQGQSCQNNNCANLIGCKCDIQGTGVGNPICIGDPCNSPCRTGNDCGPNCGCNEEKGRCEDCDRPCSSNIDCENGCYCDKGIKRCRKNPCAKGCANGKDCGPGCGCWEDKGCYPCDSFDCLNCENVNGCKCSDGVNCAKKKSECDDELKIVSDDDNCALIGELTTKDCCPCNDIGYHVNATLSATGVLDISAVLRKGHTATSPLLDMTGIVNDFPPISGTILMDIVAVYLDGTRSTFQEDVVAEWGGAGVNLVSNVFLNTVACAIGNNTLQKVEISFATSVNFAFPNGCTFSVPAGTKIQLKGCGSSVEAVIKMLKFSGCKKPIFTWYKNNVSFRKAYALSAGPNFYKDTVTGIEGAEVCRNYRLETDCGCDRSTVYSCFNDETRPTNWVPCNPKDMVITVEPNTCNRTIHIAQLTTCAAFDGQIFSLYINGTLYAPYTVIGGLIFTNLTINSTNPITTVELRFPCDGACNKCNIIKTLNTNNPCSCAASPLTVNITGTPSCESGLTFQITGGEPTYRVVVVRSIAGVEHEAETFEYNGAAPITQNLLGPLDPGTYIIKVTDRFGCETRDTRVLDCCNLGNMSASYDCDTQEIVINRSTTFGLEYNIGAGWLVLSANNRIAQVLANGTYPNYLELRKVGEPTCTRELDVVVDCNACGLNITSAALNSTCDQVTIATNTPFDQYSLNNNTTWVAGVSPINLGAPLANGGVVKVWVRNSADPTCMDSIELRCNTCTSHAIGSPLINFDCALGNIELVGLTDPPVPVFCLGGDLVFKYRINGSAWTTILKPRTYWTPTMVIATGLTLGLGAQVIEIELYIKCPGAPECLLGTFQDAIVNTDTLLTVSYNCNAPNQGLQWTGTPLGVVQVMLNGVWTGVVSGTLIANAGVYQIRDLGAGPYCATPKLFTVPNCGGGGGGGTPQTDCDVAAGLLQVIDNCNGSITVTNGYGASVNVVFQIRDNNAGTCTGAVIHTQTRSGLPSGASHTFTGVPTSNGTRVYQVAVPGSGDSCVSCKVGPACAGAACSLTQDPVLECVPTFGSNIQIKVTNNNTQEVAIYLDNIYKQNLQGGGFYTTLNGSYSAGNHTVKFVCLSDITVFRSKTQNFNC